ncbi:MAG: bacillithiol biosynthesis cysteine-adding enzyme BshC [Vicinamibacterales bacterium]
MTDRPHAPRSSALDIRGLPGIRPLAADYATGAERLATFYAGDPAHPDAWPAAIERARGHERARAAVGDVVGAQLERRGAPAAARARAALLANPEAVAVVTGQQAGLFGGPLYTLLKALTAIEMAKRVSREHGVPSVAVFWVESEDHDWDEIDSCAVLDADLQKRRIRLARPPGAGVMPVAWLRLDEGVSAALEALAATLRPTDFTAELLSGLRKAYRPGVGVADAFARWLDASLGDLGLVVFDASDPAAKPLVRHVYLQEIEQPGRASRLASEAGERLSSLGYHAQVVHDSTSVALFRIAPGAGRQPIRLDGNGFAVGEARIGRDELVREVEADPAAFSPNVLLRPLVQDTLFPTVAYVAGPNELAYLGQMKGVYEAFGVPMPLMALRAAATILDSAAARFVARYDVPLPALAPDDEAALNRLLERQLPGSVEEAYREARSAVESRMEALISSVPAIDPTLEGAARSALGRMRHDLDTLHAKIIHAAKRRHETLRRQFRRTRAQAFPGDEPQERVIGWVYFLNQYGPALIDTLAAEIPAAGGRHLVVRI